MTADSTVTFVPKQSGRSEGYLVFTRDKSLMAQAFDAATLRVSGNPKDLGVTVATNPAVGATLGIAHSSASGSTLAYVAPAPSLNQITVVQNWMAGL